MSGYRYHVKVLLASGVVEHYYPEFEQQTINIGMFRIYKEDEFVGWTFNRNGTVDYFPPGMVRGVQLGAFKGFAVNLDGEEFYCESPKDEDIIKMLGAEEVRVTKRLQAIKDYLKCKSS